MLNGLKMLQHNNASETLFWHGIKGLNIWCVWIPFTYSTDSHRLLWVLKCFHGNKCETPLELEHIRI